MTSFAGKPADPMTPKGMLIALRIRGIDPDPYKKIAESLNYPVHFIQTEPLENPTKITFWEKGDSKENAGKELKVVIEEDQTDCETKKYPVVSEKKRKKYERVAELLNKFKEVEDDFEKDDIFLEIVNEYKNYLESLAFKTVSKCNSYSPTYILSQARVDLMHRFYYAVEKFKPGKNFTTYMQRVMLEYLNGDWLWYIRKYDRIDQVTIWASNTASEDEKEINLQNLDCQTKTIPQNKPNKNVPSQMIKGIRDQAHFWSEKSSTPVQEAIRAEAVNLIREELSKILDKDEEKVVMLRYEMLDNKKYTLSQIAEIMNWRQADGAPHDKKVNRVLEKAQKKLKASEVLKQLI